MFFCFFFSCCWMYFLFSFFFPLSSMAILSSFLFDFWRNGLLFLLIIMNSNLLPIYHDHSDQQLGKFFGINFLVLVLKIGVLTTSTYTSSINQTQLMCRGLLLCSCHERTDSCLSSSASSSRGHQLQVKYISSRETQMYVMRERYLFFDIYTHF